MNTSKIKDLINRALNEDFYDKVDLSVGMGKDLLDREDIIRKASLYGTKLGDTERMLKYATRVGDTDKMAQASEAYRATRLAQALGDDDIKFIVDHADVLNKQGKDALIQLLLERNDTANLYGLNNKLGNEFINKDLKNKFTRDQAKLLDEAVANNELQRKFYSKLDDDEVAAELRGMSVDPRTDPARSRLIADRMRNGQTVDTSVDEMFNIARMPDEARDIDTISIKELGNHPRYKKWIADEERRLRGQLASSPVKDVHPTRAQASKRNRASDIKDRTEILEEAIINRYGSVDNLRDAVKNGLEGPDRFYDEAAGLLNRYDNAMDEAGYSTGKPGKIPNDKLKRLDKEDALDREELARLAAEDPQKNELAIKRLEGNMERRDIERKNTPKEININPLSRDADELGSIDEDNVMSQFIDPRDQERIKPTPRSRDYGEESLMLRDNAKADRFFKAREARGMKKERDLPQRTVNRVRGIKQTPDDRRKELIELASKSKDNDVPVYTGGKYPTFFTTEKEVLRDMYPKRFRGYGESTKEYLTPETEALFREVDARAKKAKEKIGSKYEYISNKGWSGRDYGDFVSGKDNSKVKNSRYSNRKAMFEEMGDIEEMAKEYKAKHKKTDVMRSNNDIPVVSGKYKDPMKDKATELFIRNVANQLGFRPSEQLIEQLKKYSKQAVVDWYENLADPYIKPKSRR